MARAGKSGVFKGQAVIDSYAEEVARLRAENADLKREVKRLGGQCLVPGYKRCPGCGGEFPDSPAHFGSAFNDPDRSRCASCSRAARHIAGLNHISIGCCHCIYGDRPA